MNAPASSLSAPAAAPVPSIEALDEAIRRLATELNVRTYRMLVVVREFDQRCGWEKWSFSSCAEWLHWRIGIGLSAAREKVRVAHALVGLPAIAEAFEQGRLSYSKVRALTRAADATNEQMLLEFALRATAPQVEERCRQIRNVHPDSTGEAHCAWERRLLSVHRDPARNTIKIHVELPRETGELVAIALDKAARSVQAEPRPELGGEGWHAQQADALVAMAEAYLGGTDEDAAHARADNYQVVVHVDEAALHGGAGRSDMPIETVKRVACDSTMSVVTEDSHGDPLDVGRRQRIVPLALRRALWARDRGCTFPGCGNTRFVDAHHVRHWVEGGETSAANTVLLCTRHHRLVHEGAFRMRRGADGAPEFRSPDGRLIPSCGFHAEDAVPEAAVLDDRDCPSTDAWLAALLQQPLSRPRRSSRSGP